MGKRDGKDPKQAGRSRQGAKRTLPYSDVAPDEESQPRLKHVSDVRNRRTKKDLPRITPVSQPNPTFGNRKTEPDMESVSQQDDDESAEPTSDTPPASAHLKAAASKRPLDKKPLVKDTQYSFVSKKPRKDQGDE
jgi:hypothetical protein